MSKRPLLTAVCIYALGIVFSGFFNFLLFTILIVSFIVCMISFKWSKDRINLFCALFLLIFTLGFSLAHFIVVKSTAPFTPFFNNEISFIGEIISQPDIRETKTIYHIRIKKIHFEGNSAFPGKKALISIYSTSPSSEIFKHGDIITGTGKIVQPASARNTGAFDYRRYLSSQGVYATISTVPENIKFVSRAKLNPFIRFSLVLREKIIYIIDNCLPSEEAGLLKGIVIGERNGLSDSSQKNFEISGLTHIVCVSGANIAYIAGACIFVFGLLKLAPVYSSSLTIVILIVFTYITGSSPSVVRAAIMGIVLLIGGVIQRKSDPLTSIAAASMLILLYNPLTLYDVGFQLSFAGTIGIVLFYKTLSSFFKTLPKAVNEVLSASLAAQLTVNPIIALYFNKISLIALVSNLVVVPFTGIVTILGFILSIIGYFSLFLAKLVGSLTYFFLAFMLWASKISAGIPYASIQVATPGILLILTYYALLYISLFYIPIKKPTARFYKFFYISIGLTCVIFSVSLIIPKPLQISFLDIGQGDSCFVKTPSGNTILIDGGGSSPGSFSSFDPANTLIPFILDNGKTSIDIAILSHAHADHIQGLISVVESISVKKLFIGPQAEYTKELEDLLKICSEKGTKVFQVSKGDSFIIDKVNVDFLFPSESNLIMQDAVLNNNSLVFKLSYNGISTLFTGDIQNLAEEEILKSNTNIDADILKVAHHGSPYSTSTEFLEATSPSACIISVGKNNYGHPSPSVIRRIEVLDAAVYRTDRNGGVTIYIYENKYKLRPNTS